uniref:Uncharacterized protein n=1 Tax=Arundo donax TaxID=35708 RepID=A0A0A9GNY6_ARUDO
MLHICHKYKGPYYLSFFWEKIMHNSEVDLLKNKHQHFNGYEHKWHKLISYPIPIDMHVLISTVSHRIKMGIKNRISKLNTTIRKGVALTQFLVIILTTLWQINCTRTYQEML